MPDCIAVADFNQTSSSDLAQGTTIPLKKVQGTSESDKQTLTESFALVVVADDRSQALAEVLNHFFHDRGFFPESVVILSENPSPQLLAEAFSFGIESLNDLATARDTLKALEDQLPDCQNPQTPSGMIRQIARAIRRGDQAEILSQADAALAMATHDYRLCYQVGRAREALGQFTPALALYERAIKLNSHFCLGRLAIAEGLLVLGKTEAALKHATYLGASLPFSGTVRALLAAIQAELGQFDRARDLIAEAQSMQGPSSKILEAQAQLALAQGQMKEAFQLMDDMSEVGPFFAAKLNELGIKLSQANRGKSALALYQKAHRIVRPELKYKISLNAALACRRLGDWDKSLGYLQRCEKEFGSSFTKLEKIRASLQKAKERDALQKRQAG